MKKWSIIAIIMLIIVILATSGLLFYETHKNQEENEPSSNENITNNNTTQISESDIYGTYSYSDNNPINLEIELVINSDFTATYHIKNDIEYDFTTGTYSFSNNTITYTKKLSIGSDGQEADLAEDIYDYIDKLLTFTIVDKDTIIAKYIAEELNINEEIVLKKKQ